MKIYTKTGDKGTTSLFGGKPSLKSGKIVDLIGTIDEVNSIIGVAVVSSSAYTQKGLTPVQNDLFVLGAYFAGDLQQKSKNNFKKKTLSLEKSIDNATSKVPPLKYFILPGGTAASANLHYARTVCRRLERLLVDFLNDTNFLEKEADLLTYINRLSDYLYVLARKENYDSGIDDIPWVTTKR
ncbi:cob(I)yrinic acid a,c-diamide adenosyltransferase [Patescibacteria group bacterium]|nr:cob(I)yrinic acid a,c-diamide adenosyltransferase [Patescibacteria group bacterium]